MTGNNNRSRKMCKELSTLTGWKKDSHKNILKYPIEGGTMNIAVSVSYDDFAECRQFYDDCDALLTYRKATKEFYVFLRKGLKVSKSQTRQSANVGIPAHNAHAEFRKFNKLNSMAYFVDSIDELC